MFLIPRAIEAGGAIEAQKRASEDEFTLELLVQ